MSDSDPPPTPPRQRRRRLFIIDTAEMAILASTSIVVGGGLSIIFDPEMVTLFGFAAIGLSVVGSLVWSND